jgi:HK97 family phage portal protein
MVEKPRFRVPATSQPVKAVEGEPRDGPWHVHWPDGLLPNAWGKNWNYWQMGYDPIGGFGSVAVVEACVQAYASTIAQCPGDHWRATYDSDGKPDGGRERVTNSALSRVLRNPNHYQTRSDFIMMMVRNLYLDGNAYHLAERNARFEPSALHPFDPKQSQAVVGNDQAIFYELAGNNVLEGPGGYRKNSQLKFLVPQRDVMHVKLATEGDNWLKGIPPVKHAWDAVVAQRLIARQLINLFANGGRPSGVIHTDLNLTASQIGELRARLNESWKGVDDLSGGPPILTNGLKFQNIGQSSKESDIASALRLTQDEIFMVYGVPPAILGMTDRSSFSSTEALMQFWLSGGLGFAINHIEVAFDQFFGLRGWPDEYVELDTRALLRAAYKDRIEALVRGVQGGVFSPDEARTSEDLPKTPYGDEPRVQQQVVPLSAWAQTLNQPATAPAADPAPPAPPAGETDEPREPDLDTAKSGNVLDAASFFAGRRSHRDRRNEQ